MDNALDAIVAFSTFSPDLVIVDISLNGDVSGIQLIHKINKIKRVPAIFLTANDKDEIFEKAKKTGPVSFLSKPLDPKTLERVVSLALISRPAETSQEQLNDGPSVAGFFFTKIGNRLKKVLKHDIAFVEVEGKYSCITVLDRKYHIKISLKDLHSRLPDKNFIRVSRNYVVNLDHVDNIDLQKLELSIGERRIPISRTFKEGLMSEIELI